MSKEKYNEIEKLKLGKYIQKYSHKHSKIIRRTLKNYHSNN